MASRRFGLPKTFRITGLSMHREIIKSLAQIKKAAAITNCEIGILDKKIAEAVVRACDEILSGGLHEYFIVDPIQGGAGTSLNMNANEVIANRANELLGGEKGDYSLVNPNDHVNCGQSTNDVIPTAGKITALTLLNNAQYELRRLCDAFDEKADAFDSVIKMGRTQLQGRGAYSSGSGIQGVCGTRCAVTFTASIRRKTKCEPLISAAPLLVQA